MSDEHRVIFQPGGFYTSAREIRAGFKSDVFVPIGTRLKYVEVKYSHYDGCYVYYFQSGTSADTIEVWIHEDTTIEEIRMLLPACA